MSSPHESPGDGEVFVLATNLDVIFSAEPMRFLGARRLERAAHHGGIEAVLREPMRIYRTEHLSAAGWTPEGEQERVARIEAKGVTEIQYATVTEWIDRMRRFHAPMIFTLRDWGLADRTLPETVVQAEA